MKHILLSSIAVLAAMFLFIGCETDLNSSADAPDIRPMAAKGGSTQADANPAIAYGGSVTSKGKSYAAIMVMDSDGTDQTAIFTAASTAHYAGYPSWSPDGATIAFTQYRTDTTGPSMPNTIFLCDVSVVRGKATGSNTRALISIPTRSMSWSSVTSTAKIAFTTPPTPTAGPTVQVISTSGGTPTVLHRASDKTELHFYSSVTWSPDDERIAFVDRTHGSGIDTLRVIDASTGVLLETIPLGTTGWTDIEWSRSGLNLLALTIDYGSGKKLYYVTPTSGSTPWTHNVAGIYPTWAPDNSSVLTQSMTNARTFQKTTTGTNSTSTISVDVPIGPYPKWRR